MWRDPASPGADASPTALKPSLTHSFQTSAIPAGDDLKLTLTVENTSASVVHNIRGESESAYGRLDGLEWVLGSIPAKGKRSWTTTVPLPRNSMARDVDVQVRLFSGDLPVAVEEARTAIRVQPLPRPTFAFTTRLEDSKGNGDGLLQTGETVELALNLENVGKGKAFKTRAYVRNLSGEHVFLEKGRGNVESLEPGASSPSPMNFAWIPRRRSQCRTGGGNPDTVLRSTLSDSSGFRFIPHPIEVEKTWNPPGSPEGETTVYSEHPMAVSLATLSPGVALQSDRQFGEWARVLLPEGKGNESRSGMYRLKPWNRRKRGLESRCNVRLLPRALHFPRAGATPCARQESFTLEEA